MTKKRKPSSRINEMWLLLAWLQAVLEVQISAVLGSVSWHVSVFE